MTKQSTLADRIEASSGLNIAEQPKKPGPVWFMPLDDDDQHTIVAALRAAARPAQEPVAWQPIETAPHETRVLLGWQYDGAWFCETGMASHGWSWRGISNMSRHGHATHWQPLPSPPSLTGENEK